MARQMTLRLSKVVSGADKPDTGRTVTIVRADDSSPVATAVESPAGSGLYSASFAEVSSWGYWTIDGVTIPGVSSNSPFWLGDYATHSGSFSGSLFGTASFSLLANTCSISVLSMFATQAQTSSIATSASYALSATTASYIATASYALSALSASYAPGAGGGTPGGNAGEFQYNGSGSFSGSVAKQIGDKIAISGSTEVTGTLSLHGSTFGVFLGDASNYITGSGANGVELYTPNHLHLAASKNVTIRSGQQIIDLSGSVRVTKGITGSLSGTASQAITASYAPGASIGGASAQFQYNGSGSFSGSAMLRSVGGNLIASSSLTAVTGGLAVTGAYDESTSNPGVYIGTVGGTARMLFAPGDATRNWQIDTVNGYFRWYTPGVEHFLLFTTESRFLNKKVRVMSGSLEVTGSVTASAGITGSLTGSIRTTAQSKFVYGNENNGSSKSHFTLEYWNGGQYAHSVKSRHNGGGRYGNAVDVFLWKYGTDSVGTVGTQIGISVEDSTNGPCLRVGRPVTGSADPPGNLDVVGNGTFTGPVTASAFSGAFTGSLSGTASFVATASFATTASRALRFGEGAIQNNVGASGYSYTCSTAWAPDNFHALVFCWTGNGTGSLIAPSDVVKGSGSVTVYAPEEGCKVQITVLPQIGG